ncbi:MAG: hypothetical protein V1722_03605 [Candidatus Micrarchaeota archaeon]
MKQVNTREIALLGWRKGQGTHYIKGRTVVVTPKIAIVIPRPMKWRPREQVTWQSGKAIVTSHFFPVGEVVAYPRPEDMKHFRNLAIVEDPEGREKGIHKGGPAERHRGSIGSIGVVKDVKTIPFATLTHVQSHFVTGKTKGTLPRALATKYAGWRLLALQEVFKKAAKHNLSIVVEKQVITARKRSKLFLKELHEAASRAKYNSINDDEAGIIFVPNSGANPND